jgi:hypothetical protein
MRVCLRYEQTEQIMGGEDCHIEVQPTKVHSVVYTCTTEVGRLRFFLSMYNIFYDIYGVFSLHNCSDDEDGKDHSPHQATPPVSSL